MLSILDTSTAYAALSMIGSTTDNTVTDTVNATIVTVTLTIIDLTNKAIVAVVIGADKGPFLNITKYFKWYRSNWEEVGTPKSPPIAPTVPIAMIAAAVHNIITVTTAAATLANTCPQTNIMM